MKKDYRDKGEIDIQSNNYYGINGELFDKNSAIEVYPKNRAVDIKDLESQRGILVVVEGIDGSGKSSNIKKFIKNYSTQLNIVETNFIHSKYIKDQLIKTKLENCDPYTFLFMYLSALSYCYSEFIIPNLKAGKIVLLDRYIYTIFLKSLIQGIDMKYLESCCKIFRKPDIYIYLKADEKICLERKLNENRPLSYWECGGNFCKNDKMRYRYDLEERKRGFCAYQLTVQKTFFSKIYTNKWQIIDAHLNQNRIVECMYEIIMEYVENNSMNKSFSHVKKQEDRLMGYKEIHLSLYR